MPTRRAVCARRFQTRVAATHSAIAAPRLHAGPPGHTRLSAGPGRRRPPRPGPWPTRAARSSWAWPRPAGGSAARESGVRRARPRQSMRSSSWTRAIPVAAQRAEVPLTAERASPGAPDGHVVSPYDSIFLTTAHRPPPTGGDTARPSATNGGHHRCCTKPGETSTTG